MNIVKASKGYVFTRNPILLKEPFSVAEFDPKGGTVKMSIAGNMIFEGRFSPPLNMDISEIVDSAVDYFPEATPDGSSPLLRVLDAKTLADRWRFRIQARYGNIAYELYRTAVPGGVSKRIYKGYRDSDVFDHRFLNKSQNFFLTTRTTGRRIIMKETEMAPLYFITDTSFRIEIVDAGSGNSLVFQDPLPGFWALDPEALRLKFLEKFDVIPSVFKVYRDYIPAVTLIIENATCSLQRYRLKFRNSLGVFEVLELTGELTIAGNQGDDEAEEFTRFDEEYFDFSFMRNRVKLRQSATISTGIKRPEEIIFALDMAASDEVYLLGVVPEPIRVIPSIEGPDYSARPEAPQSLSVRLDFADTDAPILPETAAASNGSNRIFSKQFSKQFN